MVMNSRKLFFSRLIRNWHYQWKVLRSIADWTVIVYILVPLGVFCVAIYRSWWLEIPVWIHKIPFIVPFFCLYFLAWIGNIRTLIVEADKVFLVKQLHLIGRLKALSYFYSLFFQTMVLSAGFLCLLPFLLHYYLLNWSVILVLFVYFTALQSCFMLWKYHIRKIGSMWAKSLLVVFLFLVFNWFSQWIYHIVDMGMTIPVYALSLIILLLSIFFSLTALQKIASIDLHIELEQERKTSIVQAIYLAAPEIEKPVIMRRKKPRIFKNSKRIFQNRTPVNGFIELFIKIVIRNSSYLYGYLMLINSTTGAMIIVPPLWLKILIFVGFSIIMNGWLTTLWNKVCHYHPLMKKYMESDAYFSARKKAVRGMLSFALVLVLFLTCVFGFIIGR
ncbi:hypothetical protein C2I06_06500 [Niallia circulans]|nr:hypothetical protein C2I06_06500 [Niallia circulans]